MPALVHQFDWPDRVVVGTVGRPGSRTFYLQVRDGARSTSVALEKEQSAVLAEKIDEILDALMADDGNRFSVPAATPAELLDDEPLDQPVEEQFRTGLAAPGLGPVDRAGRRRGVPADDDDDEIDDDTEPEPSEMLLVRMPVGTARAFVERTRQVVRSGRPLCPRCGQPGRRRRPRVRRSPTRRDGPTSLAGELELVGRITVASNATFLATIGEVSVVYKPVAGEQPLWDFPDGTLAHREVAAYLVSEAFGWDVVPTTILRDGPLGPGMVQLWQRARPGAGPGRHRPRGGRARGGLARRCSTGIDEDDRPVTLIHEDSPALRRMAVFDVVVNNADRKGGHILPTTDGHRYGVDHGVSFHVEHKLRTVLWGWRGDALDPSEVAGVERVRARPGRRPRSATVRAAQRRRAGGAGRPLRPAAAPRRLPRPVGRHAGVPVAAVLTCLTTARRDPSRRRPRCAACSGTSR